MTDAHSIEYSRHSGRMEELSLRLITYARAFERYEGTGRTEHALAYNGIVKTIGQLAGRDMFPIYWYLDKHSISRAP